MTSPPVHCRYATAAELGPLVRRPLSAWLGKRELAELRHWRDTARRAQWLAGRALVKQLVLDYLGDIIDDVTQVEITSRSATGRGTRPQLWVKGRRQPWSLSLSHLADYVLAAVCVTPGYAVGVDLAPSVAEAGAARRYWLTPAERKWIEGGGSAVLVWAAKEAVYKAVNRGESFVPRQIDVELLWNGDCACVYHGAPLGGQLMTLCDERFHAGAVFVSQTGHTGQRHGVGSRMRAATMPADGIHSRNRLPTPSDAEAAHVS